MKYKLSYPKFCVHSIRNYSLANFWILIEVLDSFSILAVFRLKKKVNKNGCIFGRTLRIFFDNDLFSSNMNTWTNRVHSIGIFFISLKCDLVLIIVTNNMNFHCNSDTRNCERGGGVNLCNFVEILKKWGNIFNDILSYPSNLYVIRK